MKRWSVLFLFTFIRCSFDSSLCTSFFLQADLSDKMISFIEQADYHKFFNKITKQSTAKESHVFSEKRDYLLKTFSGISVSMTLYDRGSKDLIVFGQGFLGKREFGEKIAYLFPDYDVVIFDYRWSRIVNFLFKSSTLLHPIEKFLLEEEEEVRTVVQFVSSKKNYEQVIGLAQCYSCFTFAKAHYLEKFAGRKLFTKLIFDSCWYSFYDLSQQITKNPMLLFNSQGGEIPHEIEKILCLNSVQKIVSSIVRIVIPDVSIAHYLSSIENTPVLFIHGMQDRVVPFKTVFPKIWDSVAGYKACFITPQAHSKNSDDQLLYHYICDTFIQSDSIEKFLYDARNLCKM